MQPTYWQLGIEVHGNQSNAANGADFTYNIFWPYGGSWRYTISDAAAYVQSPAVGYWAIPPHSSSTGGDWYTYCGC